MYNAEIFQRFKLYLKEHSFCQSYCLTLLLFLNKISLCAKPMKAQQFMQDFFPPSEILATAYLDYTKP